MNIPEMNTPETNIQFLLITANENETKAILNCESFKHKRFQSKDPQDTQYYNIGKFGCYQVAHVELQQQGSAQSGSAILSIYKAINFCSPVAVILVGIAFGKDGNSQGSQKIGDVLISEKIADYESGKVTPKEFQSYGSIADAGPKLYAAFHEYSKSWHHNVGNSEAKCLCGIILSGDKVIDSAEFKKDLFARYPHAIGGEMEGRGAYAACRDRGISEWIVVKAICDWGENKNNPNKAVDQKIAAESAASLIEYMFNQKDAFSKLPKASQSKEVIIEDSMHTPSVQGYLVYIGTTSCRLFSVLSDRTLRELKISTYYITDTTDDNYLNGIIDTVKSEILPEMESGVSQKLQKVFVNSSFEEIFRKFDDSSVKRDFIRRFYQKTKLYFNLLSKAQTEDNLRRLFSGSIENGTAIVTIGSPGVEILLYENGEFNNYILDLPLNDIENYVKGMNLAREWSKQDVLDIKNYIRKRIGNRLNGLHADKAIILKGELTFMRDTGYALKDVHGHLSLTHQKYREDNRKFLFYADYESRLRQYYPKASEPAIKRLYGFRYGHILIETLLDILGNKRVIPRDDLTIHGSPINAYIFNVVISGSTHNGREKHMLEAHRLINKIGANVLSPRVIGNELASPITSDSEYEHLKAIDECDVLFISNAEDGYIGDSTKREIYYAYALMKTIAFWSDPPEDTSLDFIPYEHWGSVEELI